MDVYKLKSAMGYLSYLFINRIGVCAFMGTSPDSDRKSNRFFRRAAHGCVRAY